MAYFVENDNDDVGHNECETHTHTCNCFNNCMTEDENRILTITRVTLLFKQDMKFVLFLSFF